MTPFPVIQAHQSPLSEDVAVTGVDDNSQPAEVVTQDATAEVESGFAGFGLPESLLEALERCGYQQPSPIQAAAIPELMLGRDLLGQAQTGTGKTAAFALPLLARIDLDARQPQVLVLAPTRELAIQVSEAFQRYAACTRGLHVLALYGGSDFRDQIQKLRRGVQVVVGTPGRVMDHMRQGTLDVSGLHALVLDEADEMLRMGFIDDVQWVLEQLPTQRQVVLFSATMPPEIKRICQQHLQDPAEVIIRTQKADASRIRQRHILLPHHQKLGALLRVLEAHGPGGVIIFARTKAVTVTVAEALDAEGMACAVLNGDVPQSLRERTVERLKQGKVDVLVATDVAARGLDVDRIGLVINYDAPFDSEAYVHRIGRTGRAGREGDAILFLSHRERRLLHSLERAVGSAIEAMEVPSDAEINQQRLDNLQQQLNDLLEQPVPQERQQEVALMEEIIQRLSRETEATPEQLALAALRLAQGDQPLLVVPQPQQAPRQGRQGERGERRQGRPNSSMERFRVEVGWRDRIKPGHLVGAIANETGLDGRQIGKITIFDDHSTVDLPQGMPPQLMQSLQRVRVMQKELQISRLDAA
ncbi:MAG: ATP-dependent helicase [Synechococcus sp. MED-G71]|nr:MAG: ATP-dependent helicase [Synechococcus sp. MED-G71]